MSVFCEALLGLSFKVGMLGKCAFKFRLKELPALKQASVSSVQAEARLSAAKIGSIQPRHL